MLFEAGRFQSGLIEDMLSERKSWSNTYSANIEVKKINGEYHITSRQTSKIFGNINILFELFPHAILGSIAAGIICQLPGCVCCIAACCILGCCLNSSCHSRCSFRVSTPIKS